MSLEPQLQELLCHTIYVAAELGANQAGDPAHASARPVRARVDPSSVLIQTRPNGEDDLSEYAIITTEFIGAKDLVWHHLADPYDPGQGRLPKRTEVLYDADGSISHYEVLI
jgi:hypothetical protein